MQNIYKYKIYANIDFSWLGILRKVNLGTRTFLILVFATEKLICQPIYSFLSAM